jgi:hypothetical protein
MFSCTMYYGNGNVLRCVKVTYTAILNSDCHVPDKFIGMLLVRHNMGKVYVYTLRKCKAPFRERCNIVINTYHVLTTGCLLDIYGFSF